MSTEEKNTITLDEVLMFTSREGIFSQLSLSMKSSCLPVVKQSSHYFYGRLSDG